MNTIQTPLQRLYLHNVQIDNDFLNHTGSIVLPYRVRRIVGICPNIVNGVGLLSLYNENSNEQLINQQSVADDKRHINKKMIPLINYPDGGNLRFTLNLIDGSTDMDRECRLKVYIKYEE